MESAGFHRGSLLAVMSVVAIAGLHELVAHGTEARRVVVLTWPKDRITRVLDVNRSELGLNGSKVPATLKTIGGRSCLYGDLFAFDIDDRYAYDIDEPVDVTVLYASDITQPFTVAWDQNAGNGFGRSELVTPEPGAELRQVTIHMDRARFAGQGILGTDLAIGARGAIVLCDLVVVRSGSTPPAAPVGTLRVEVLDEQTGRAVPARLGLYDTTGRPPLPSDQSLQVHRYADETRLLWTAPRLVWPNPNRQVFYVDGNYEAEVPAGTYQLVASKGPEYRVYQGTIDVEAGQTTAATVTLERYIDQPSRRLVLGRRSSSSDARPNRGCRRVGLRHGRRRACRQPPRDGQHRYDPLSAAGLGECGALPQGWSHDCVGPGGSAHHAARPHDTPQFAAPHPLAG